MSTAESKKNRDAERIAAEIASDDSPVGIDAKKTHVMILLALERLENKLSDVEQRLADLERRR